MKLSTTTMESSADATAMQRYTPNQLRMPTGLLRDGAPAPVIGCSHFAGAALWCFRVIINAVGLGTVYVILCKNVCIQRCGAICAL